MRRTKKITVKSVLNLPNPQNRKRIRPSPIKLLQVNQTKNRLLIVIKFLIIEILEVFTKMKKKEIFFSINMASMMKIMKDSETIFQRSLLSSKDLIRLVLAQVTIKTMKLITFLMLKQAAWARMTTTWKSSTFLESHLQQKNRRKWKERKKLATRGKRGERLSMISSTSSKKLITSLRFKKEVECKILTLQRALSNMRSTQTMPHLWMICSTQLFNTKIDLSCVPRLSSMLTRNKFMKLTKTLSIPKTEN